MQQLLFNLSRVYDSQQLLRRIESRGWNGLWKLTVSADLNWRRGDWNAAIDFASRALPERPKDFHALAVLATSYGSLGKTEIAYPLAKRLLQATPPNWVAVKLLFRLASLILFSKRSTYAPLIQKCDMEADSDRKILAWAQDLVSKVEAGDREHAV